MQINYSIIILIYFLNFNQFIFAKEKSKINFYELSLLEDEYCPPSLLKNYNNLNKSIKCDLSRFLTVYISQKKFNIYMDTKNFNQTIFNIYVSGKIYIPVGSSDGLARCLFALFPEAIPTTQVEHIFASGSFITPQLKKKYSEWEKKEITLKKYSEWEKKINLSIQDIPKNLKFTPIGGVQRKIASVIKYVKDNRKNHAALFLPNIMKSEIESIIIELKSQTKGDREPLISILKKINYINDEENIKNLTPKEIQTFNYEECPEINPLVFCNFNANLIEYILFSE